MFELGPFNYAFKDAAASKVGVTHNPYAWNKVGAVGCKGMGSGWG